MATTAFHPASAGSAILARDAIERVMEREIARLRRTVRRVPSAEFQRGGDELDVTALRQGHEADQAIRARCAEGIAELVEALVRLRESPGAFGLCEECGRPIPWARLEILPAVRTCRDCPPAPEG